MNKKPLSGIYTASITPFTEDDHISGAAYEALLNMNIAQGITGAFIGGSSAECFLLSPQERIASFEIAASFKDRTRLIAHVGAISTRQAIIYAKEAQRLGFNALAATPPYYYGFSSSEICSYYYDIYNAVGMPMLLYNFPGNTGKEFNLSDPNFKALLQSEAIYGIKHTSLNLFQLERIRHLNARLTLFNGFDETMVAGLAFGADGSIGSTFNFMYPHYSKIYNLYQSGEGEKALELQVKANNIMEAICKVGLIPSIKYILTTQGIAAGRPRAPFHVLTAEERCFVDAVLKDNLCND